jgi:hypothetical protein
VKLDAKAGPRHYVILALTMLGVWYVLQMVGGKHSLSTPLTQTTADISTVIILGG